MADNSTYNASEWATGNGGLSQNALLDLWNKAGADSQFMNQGSLSWDQVADYGSQQAAGQALGNSRWVPDGDDNPENDFYIQRNPDGTLGLVNIMRHGWNGEFVTFAAPIVTAGLAAAYGIGAGAATGVGTEASTTAGTTAGGWNAAMDSQLASQQLGYTGADMVAAGYSGGVNLGSLGGEMATGLGGAAAAGGGGGGGAAGGTSAAGGGGGEAAYGWNPEGYTGGTPSMAGGGGIGGGSTGGSLGGLNMDWGDWIKLGAQVGSTYLQNKAVGDAAQQNADATNASIAEQRRQFDLTRSDFAPYRQAGVNALGQLAGDINTPVTAAEVMAQPGYQFGQQQGQQAIDRKIAASGGRVSGAAIKAAARFGTDYATTGYNAEYQRRQDRLNRLAALAGIGQTSTGASAQAGAQATDSISRLRLGNAATQGAAGIAQSNIWGNAGNQIAAMAGRYFGGGSSGGIDYGGFRYDDPYRNPGYVGGMEGE
jgi:hypothetical protein